MEAAKRISSRGELVEIQKKRQQSRAAGKDRILVCAGGSCLASGADRLHAALEEEAKRQGNGCHIVATGCMGPCSRGPLVQAEASGKIFAGARPEDAAELLRASAGNESELSQLDAEHLFENQQKIVLRNCGKIDPLEMEEYIEAGGYQALGSVVESMDGDAVIETLKSSGLRGRGGAGFPTWMKWSFTRRATGEMKYVLCNADEGDPGAFMDRSVLEGDPHSVIEGMAIAAYAVGATQGYIYVRAEYPLAVQRLTRAIEQARSRGLLGKDILGRGFDFDLEIRKGSGAFVCGEETALMNSIEGKRGEPRPRPPFPAQKGLWGMPSLLNNVETYANVPAIFLYGAEWYAQYGTVASRGTKVFALAGAVENTGLVEVPIGTSLGELIYDIGNGMKGGRAFKAAQIGGPSGGCVPREYLNVSLDYESLQELGAIMGSGGLIAMDDETCMVDVARFFLEFVQEESCGKCVPCRVGTKRMLEILNRICEGHGEMEDIDRLEKLGTQIKETALCGLGQTAPNPVLSTIRHFRHEYEEHIRNRHCDAGICAALVRAPCQSACPAGVDVPGFVSLVAEKRFAEALQLHRERNPFAAVCARVCFHTCEERCRRATLDESVAIRSIKRFMVDQEVTVQLPEYRVVPENEEKKIGIIGAGPAGLSCAYFLARMGYRPVIFEAEQRPGGMLVQAIPAYRLPRETIAREVRMIEQLGVEIRTGKRLGRDITLGGMKKEGYDAVFLGVGAPGCVGLGVPGEDASGVVLAGEFLAEYNIRGSVPVGKHIVVVGGGNAAVDAARTALRLGPESVTIVYRRTQEQMPAYAEEIEEALLEGVKLETLTNPVEVVTDSRGAVAGVKCAPMCLGEFDRSGRRRPTASDEDTFVLEADQVIVAIGQTLDAPAIADGLPVTLTDDGFIATDALSGQTSLPWLYAAGDAATGPASVVMAIAGGERAAVAIDRMLTGSSHAFWRVERTLDTSFDPDADPVPYPREKVRTIDPARRRHNFDEVEMPWYESVALRQAQRCLRCDYGKAPVTPVETEDSHV